jgi:hypothetical protein
MWYTTSLWCGRFESEKHTVFLNHLSSNLDGNGINGEDAETDFISFL